MIGDSKDITEAPDACYIDQQKIHICRRAQGKPGSDYEEFVTYQQLQSFMKVRIFLNSETVPDEKGVRDTISRKKDI